MTAATTLPRAQVISTVSPVACVAFGFAPARSTSPRSAAAVVATEAMLATTTSVYTTLAIH